MIAVIMTLTRMYIAISIAISLFVILRKAKVYVKILFILSVLVGIYYVTSSQAFYDIEKLTNQEISQNENYVRVVAAYFYLNNFSPNNYAKYLGNGEASRSTSYGKYVTRLENDLHMNEQDIGFIGLFVKFGILSIIAYIIIYFRIFQIKVPKEFLYIKMYMIFLLINGFNCSATFHTDFIASIAITLYLFHYFEYLPDDESIQYA